MVLKEISLFGAPHYRFILGNFATIVALVLLASASSYLILNRPEIANQVAEYAFYLFIIAVISKITQNVIYNRYLGREGSSLES